MDSSRFKEILLPLGTMLYKVAYRIVGDEDIAKDMVQDAYMSMWNKREYLEDLDNVESFAVKVVKNRCVDYLRTRHIYNGLDDGAQETESCIDETDVYEHHERLDRVMQMMNCLPERQKRVLLMRSVQDLSMEEIGQVTGLTDVNVRTLLSRARKRLREMCETEEFK